MSGFPWSAWEQRYLRENYHQIRAQHIAVRLNRTVPSIYRKARRLGITQARQNDPDLSPSNALAYLLGAYYGDGTLIHYRTAYGVAQQVTSSKVADEFETSSKKIGLNPYRDLVLPSRKGRKTIHRVRTFSKRLYELLERLDLDTARAYLRDEGMKLEFLRGIHESDGCITRNGKSGLKLSFAIADPEVASLIVSLVAEFGVKLKTYDKGNCFELWSTDTPRIQGLLSRMNPVIRRRPK